MSILIKTSVGDEEPGLFPISIEGKCGYIDAAGKIVIEPKFLEARNFSEGLAVVRIAGTTAEDRAFEQTYQGFIGPNGEFVVPPEPPRGVREIDGYDCYSFGDFHEGLARLHINDASGMDGYVDRQGQLVVNPAYASGGDYSEGLAYVETWRPWDQPGPKRKGFIDQRGEFVIEDGAFFFTEGFSEGRAVVWLESEREARACGLIDRRGKYVIPPGVFDRISNPVGGAIVVANDGRVGLVNRDGAIAIAIGVYDDIQEPFNGRIFTAKTRGTAVLIDATGKRLGEVAHRGDIGRFRDGMATIKRDGRYGYIDDSGTERIAPRFDAANPFEHGLAFVTIGETRGYINREGGFVWKTDRWEEPLRYSVSNPLTQLLPDTTVQALPLSYNWERVKNAIVFVVDGDLEALRAWYKRRCSGKRELADLTDYDTEPGKIDLMISRPGESHLEVYAVDGVTEAADGFVEFYSCKNMNALRKKHPTKVVGILIEN